MSEAIRRLLSAQHEQSLDDGSGDVLFVLFLEPVDDKSVTDAPSFFERMVNYVVRHCQPSPVMVHCELVVPPAPASSQPVNFATYLGQRSGWQTDRATNAQYYGGDTANRWRALPIFGRHLARLARTACDESCDVEYSLKRYVSAAWGVRQLAALVPDGPRQPAHCATLAARVLNRAVPNFLKHSSAFYGPASLYGELVRALGDQEVVPDVTAMGDLVPPLETLMRHSDSVVARMSEADFLAAIRALTLRVSAAAVGNDAAMQIMAQKQLANALLRWSVLRNV